MPIPIKLMVGPSSHNHQLKSGQIKYQESKPASPIWRILLIDESNNRMHLRVSARQPSAEDIDKIVMGMLSSENLLSNDIVVPKTVEKLCPGLQEKLMANGATVYLPAHGFASGSLAGKEADKFISTLEMSLSGVRESMASCEEIAATAGNPFGYVSMALWLDDNKDMKFKTAYKMAEDIAHRRGRDPELGRKMRQNESPRGPLNKGKHVPPPEDVLSTLLSNRHWFLGKPGMWDIISQLNRVRYAEPEQKLSLIQNLGALAVRHQIAGIRRGYYSFLSSLSFHLWDKSLCYLVSLSMKEAFKMPIVLDEGLLHILAARVAVYYPQDCVDLSLRGVPAHHQLQKMVQELSGGKIAILPEIASFNPGIPEFLVGLGPFGSLQFSDRTPLNPEQCLIPVTKAGSQKSQGLLIVLAILPRDTKIFVPIGDHELAGRMTSLVNERLARNGKGVTCHIAPLQMYGDLMEIGDPPHDFRKVGQCG